MENKIQKMYKRTDAYKEPIAFNFRIENFFGLRGDCVGEDGCVKVFQQAYLDLTGELLSNDYMNAVFPTISAHPISDWTIRNLAKNFVDICDIKEYGYEKLAIICDYFKRIERSVPFVEFYTKFNPTMTDEEFIALCSRLDEIISEAVKSFLLIRKLEEAKKVCDKLSVVWPEASEHAAECIIKLENTPTFSQYIVQEISKLPDMIEIKEFKKK